MISIESVREEFRLELEPNFSKVLAGYIASRSCAPESAGQAEQIVGRLNTNLLSIVDLEELLAKLPCDRADGRLRERWCGEAPLKTGEQLFLNHLLVPGKYSLLTAMFNQFAPNNMFRIAWAYIADDAERKYGVLFIERQREDRKQEERDIYDFWSFIYEKRLNCVTHYARHRDYFALGKPLRMNLIFEGFRKTGELIEACSRNPEEILLFRVKNIFNSIINPLYTFFQDASRPAGRQ
jgi:hypothetical protein